MSGLLLTLLARASAAQPPTAALSGVVYDSLGHAPLAGAIVQLVTPALAAPVARTVSTDSVGRFTFEDVPFGRYLLGFFHPLLDSLGLEPATREVYVNSRRPMRFDLATPSPEGLRAVVCGYIPTPDSSAVVIGIVRDARSLAPVEASVVSAEWVEFALSRDGLARRVPRIVTTSASNGWFALCNVPRTGTIALIAGRGADSTDLIEVPAPAEALVRRDLYLGPAVEFGRLAGVVVGASDRAVLAGALVSTRSGPQVRADAQGAWSLSGVPLGSRMLEVRAVGHFPERRVVDVVTGTAPIHTALATITTVLDTMKVMGTRIDNLASSGFSDRRRTGLGHFVTAEDIERRRPAVTSELFRQVPGLRVERGGLGETEIRMRSLVTERCRPAVYLNGQYMSILSADEIDDFVGPDEVAAIEIYNAGTVPVQFEPAMSGCGSIVIWTKPRSGRSDRMPWRQRLLRVLLFGVAGWAFGTLIS